MCKIIQINNTLCDTSVDREHSAKQNPDAWITLWCSCHNPINIESLSLSIHNAGMAHLPHINPRTQDINIDPDRTEQVADI